MLVFVVVATGFLLYIAFLLAGMFLSGIVWVLSSLGLWLMDLKPRPTSRKNITSSTQDPPQVRKGAEVPGPSDIWPKWTPAHRRYVDEEQALWQAQFDALNFRK